MGQGVAQVMLELAPLLGIAVEVGIVEVIATAPAILGGIERKVGVADDRLGGDPVVG